jgi:hypothetical protein
VCDIIIFFIIEIKLFVDIKTIDYLYRCMMDNQLINRKMKVIQTYMNQNIFEPIKSVNVLYDDSSNKFVIHYYYDPSQKGTELFGIILGFHYEIRMLFNIDRSMIGHIAIKNER